MKNYLKLMILTLIMMLSVFLLAYSQENGLTEAEKAMITENVVVPSPSDLFIALDKMGDVNWSKSAVYNTKFVYNNNYLRALNLGVRGAEGFIAIQTQDKVNLASMISVIIKIAEELGASDTILEKRTQFENYARKDQWFELRGELDKIGDDIRLEFNNQGEKDVAFLLSIGGWIEGLRITSDILSSNYNKENSTILYQPILVEYFETKFDELDMKVQKQDVVKQIKEKIPEIKNLINVGYNNPIPVENIKMLHNISSQLISAIEKGK